MITEGRFFETLCPTTVQHAMTALQGKTSHKDVKAIFTKFDEEDGNGMIDFHEFCLIMQDQLKGVDLGKVVAIVKEHEAEEERQAELERQKKEGSAMAEVDLVVRIGRPAPEQGFDVNVSEQPIPIKASIPGRLVERLLVMTAEVRRKELECGPPVRIWPACADGNVATDAGDPGGYVQQTAGGESGRDGGAVRSRWIRDAHLQLADHQALRRPNVLWCRRPACDGHLALQRHVRGDFRNSRVGHGPEVWHVPWR